MQASREQLEDVWEKEDEMPKEDFEPKKFFLMHGEYTHTCGMFTNVYSKWAMLGLRTCVYVRTYVRMSKIWFEHLVCHKIGTITQNFIVDRMSIH